MGAKHFYLDASADGLKLGCLLYKPSEVHGKPVGIVQLVHGMCEHKERYIPFMEFLSENGYVCVIHDHRGHGESVRSQEDLGYFYSGGWSAMIEDIRIVNEYVRKEFPDLSLTLLGHSMGSMAVRAFAKKYDNLINKLVVCGSPSDNPIKGLGKAITNVFGALGGWHARPNLLQKMSLGGYDKGLENEGRNAWICTNLDIRKAYNTDPLCTFQFTTNGFKNLLGLMQNCYSEKDWRMSNPNLPIFFISGKLDPCRINDAKFDEAVEFMKKVGYTNVVATSYEGMRHEILNETNKQIVWNDVLDFLK